MNNDSISLAAFTCSYRMSAKQIVERLIGEGESDGSEYVVYATVIGGKDKIDPYAVADHAHELIGVPRSSVIGDVEKARGGARGNLEFCVFVKGPNKKFEWTDNGDGQFIANVAISARKALEIIGDH